jgi:hypothetical protein
MWIFLNNAFLSIVAHRDKPDLLLVRARAEGDIKRTFPDSEIWEDPVADYRYRAELPRPEVAAAIAERVSGIEYDNFKGSVQEADRHDAYLHVWSAMIGFQEK